MSPTHHIDILDVVIALFKTSRHKLELGGHARHRILKMIHSVEQKEIFGT